MNHVGHSRGLGDVKRVDGVRVGASNQTMGTAAGAPLGRVRGRLAASLYHWFAGPYQDLPINYDGTYSEAEVDAITDQWNRYYFLQFCLAQAGVLGGGPAGAGHVSEVGVSHGAA